MTQQAGGYYDYGSFAEAQIYKIESYIYPWFLTPDKESSQDHEMKALFNGNNPSQEK
jgi:hypothetical protein